MRKMTPRGGNLFSSLIGLQRPLINPALGALPSGGPSLDVEKAQKGIFGSSYRLQTSSQSCCGSKETKQMIKLNELLKKCPPHLKTLTQQFELEQLKKVAFLVH